MSTQDETLDSKQLTISKIETALDNFTTFYEKAFFLQNETKSALTSILHSKTQATRELLEMYLQLLSEVKAKLIQTSTETGELEKDNVDLFFPSINDPDFNIKLSEISRFLQYSIPEIDGIKDFTSERSANFNRTSPQNFVASYISPDTPYNGILLWHGVGAGKTCAALGIAETFLNIDNDLHKKILILTPSEQLHSEWRKEIFNLSKEISKDRYNIYLSNGGNYQYFEWLLKGSPIIKDSDSETSTVNTNNIAINNIQCTGNKYNPLKTKVSEQIKGSLDKNKKK